MNTHPTVNKRYVVWLEPIEPLLLGVEQTVGNYRVSGEVISGRTLRGAVAAVLRRHAPELFDTLFVEPEAGQQVRFGPFFPAASADNIGPPPATAVSCKYYPGVNEHGVFDTLIHQYAFEVVTRADRHVLPRSVYTPRCPVCGEAAEPYQKFEVEPERISTTHVAINRARRVAEDAQLYTREGVGSGTYYAGYIYLPEERVSAFNEALAWVEAGLRVGANRSRGMGLIRVAGVEEAPGEQSALAQRVQHFNRRLHEVLQSYSNETGQEYEESYAAAANRYFTLDLQSSAVLLDDGLPVAVPTLDMPASVQRQWTEWSSVGGWHSAARLPRRTQPAIRGTYLYCWDDEPNYEKLLELEYDGVGDMREQGFGQLSICNPVHLSIGRREE